MDFFFLFHFDRIDGLKGCEEKLFRQYGNETGGENRGSSHIRLGKWTKSSWKKNKPPKRSAFVQHLMLRYWVRPSFQPFYLFFPQRFLLEHWVLAGYFICHFCVLTRSTIHSSSLGQYVQPFSRELAASH